MNATRALEPNLDVEPDGDLVQRAQRYEPEALAETFDTNFDRIYSFLYAGLGDEYAAEELAGEVFIKALDELPGYRSPGPGMTAFLYRLAQSVLAARLRQTARQAAGAQTQEGGPVDELTAVREALGEVRDDAGKVVMFRFLGGMDSEEIAHVTGFSHSRVLALQNRGLKLLQAALRKKGLVR